MVSATPHLFSIVAANVETDVCLEDKRKYLLDEEEQESGPLRESVLFGRGMYVQQEASFLCGGREIVDAAQRRALAAEVGCPEGPGGVDKMRPRSAGLPEATSI